MGVYWDEKRLSDCGKTFVRRICSEFNLKNLCIVNADEK